MLQNQPKFNNKQSGSHTLKQIWSCSWNDWTKHSTAIDMMCQRAKKPCQNDFSLKEVRKHKVPWYYFLNTSSSKSKFAKNCSENLLEWRHAASCFERCTLPKNSTTRSLFYGYDHLSWYKEANDQEDTPQLIATFWMPTNTHIVPSFMQSLYSCLFSCPPKDWAFETYPRCRVDLIITPFQPPPPPS